MSKNLSVLLFLQIFLHGASSTTEVESPSVKKAETVSFPKVKVEVHMESRCPDTTNFIEHQLWTVWGDLKGIIDLEIIPFGKASCLPRDNDFLCSCQHLERECLLNQLMNCVIDHVNKSVEAYLPVIRCLQGKDMDSAADRCLRAATITSRPLIECANGKKGRQLHAEAGKKTKALDPSMYFVPWVLINGKREERALGDFKGVVCDTYTGRPKPEICGH